MRAGHLGVQGHRHGAVAQRLHHLDDAGHARGVLGVADVGLDRAEQQGSRAVLAVGGEQGARLDRVAQRGAGAVPLDQVHVRAGQPALGEHLPDEPALRGSVRRGEPVGGAVLVDPAGEQGGEHGVAVGAGVGEPFQHDDPGALAPAGAVGRVAERLAPAVAGQTALPGELGVRARHRHHRHAAGQRQRRLVAAQRLHGQVDGDQRGRARRVDRERRALQAQDVGEPPGQHAGRGPGEQVAVLGVLGCRQQPGELLRGAAEEDAGAAAPQRERVDAGPLQRLPGQLQQQPLLGVGGHGLARRDPEELRVEVAGAVDEPALQRGRPLAVRGAVEAGRLPTPVGGERAHPVDAVAHQPPQVLGVVDATGEAARHPDDRDRLGGPAAGLGELLLESLRVGDRPAQVVAKLVVLGHQPSAPPFAA